MNPLFRRSYPAADLFRDHPPRLRHSHKLLLLSLAYPEDTLPQSDLEVTQWPANLPSRYSLADPTSATLRPDFYDYAPLPAPAATLEWHVNFADPRVFCAYGSPLFAQDEIQAAEHPLLGSLREALLSDKLSTKTDDVDGPTPILVYNVERRLAVDTQPSSAAPSGLYGNRFQSAPANVIRQATRVLSPSTFSNVIAIAAPTGSGRYSRFQIGHIFTTAHTGFAAAAHETKLHTGQATHTVIHTGFWGCGAFGGSRTLMIALQLLAATAAGIPHIVIHTGNLPGLHDAESGKAAYLKALASLGQTPSLDEIITCFDNQRFTWGSGDGN